MLWKLENEEFEILTQPYFAQVRGRQRYKQAQNFSEGLCAVGYYAAGQYRSNRPWDSRTEDDVFFGYLDWNGDLKLAPRFRVAQKFSEGFAYVEGLPEMWDPYYGSRGYYINHFGSEVFENVGAMGNDFSCGHALVGQVDSARFIDTKGNFTSENLRVVSWTQYTMDSQHALLFSVLLREPNYKLDNGLMPLCSANSSKFGFVNHEGDFKIPAIFDFAFPMSEGIARVMHGNEVAFINKEGERVGDRTYLAAGDFSEGLASVEFFDGTAAYFTGVINTNGDLVFKREIKDLDQLVGNYLIGPYSCGRAAFMSNEENGYFDTSGNLIMSNKYSALYNFKEGLAWAQKKKGQHGDDGLVLIDVDGNERFYLAEAYTANEFSEGISAVQHINGPWGFIRKKSVVP